MEVITNNYMPGEPRLVQQLVNELKSQGIFDQFRKECFADVDTKPAYQNLRQRVEGSVAAFLKEQTWSPDMNKNQVREQLKKNIYESGYLETGVERIVDQVVNPKINTVFLPIVEDVVYKYLGIEKPKKNCENETQKVEADLLPKDLEAVSPESQHNSKQNDPMEDTNTMNSKIDEDESPPFEPLEGIKSAVSVPQEETSMDSELSGILGLQSHESNMASESKSSQMDWTWQDTQTSQNSSESKLSVLTSEEQKIEIHKDFTFLKAADSFCKDTEKTDDSVGSITVEEDELTPDSQSNKIKEDKIAHTNNSDEMKFERHNNDKKYKEKKEDKRNEENKSKDSQKHSSKNHKNKSHSKDRDRSSSHHRSSQKDKDNSEVSSKSKDKNKDESKNYKEKNSDKDRNEKDKIKDKDSKSKEKSHEKSTKEKYNNDKNKYDKDRKKEKTTNDKEKDDKEKSTGEKSHKYRSEKNKSDKDKTNKDKEKNKEKETRDRSRDKTDKNKDGLNKNGKKEGDIGKDSIGSSDKNSSSNYKKESISSSRKRSDKDSKSMDKHKKDKQSEKSSDKNKEKRSDSKKDDHYSSKEKKNHRRSFDRDSNDGKSSKSSNAKTSESKSVNAQHSSKDTSSKSVSGSGDSGNSEAKEVPEQAENSEIPVQTPPHVGITKMKYIKPKFALNFEEAKRIMKIRKQLAILERQNQLSLADLTILPNGFVKCVSENNEDKGEESTQSMDNEETISGSEKTGDNIQEETKESAEKISSADLNLQSIFLSKENWEALEARLEQEMLKLNFSAYESQYDDYDDDNDYSSITISPMKNNVVNKSCVIEEMIPKKDLKKIMDNESVGDGPHTSYANCKKAMDHIIVKEEENIQPRDIIEETVEHGDQIVQMDDSHMEADICVVKTEKHVKTNVKERNNCVKEHENIQAPLGKQLSIKLENISILESGKSPNTRDSVDTSEDDIESSEEFLGFNPTNVLKNHTESTQDTFNICTHLEKPDYSLLKRIDSLKYLISKLENDLKYSVKEYQNNILPDECMPIKKRGRKRKLDENVDVKNNNNSASHHDSPGIKRKGRPPKKLSTSNTGIFKTCNNTEILLNDQYSLPLSPAESVNSTDKKEEYVVEPIKKNKRISNPPPKRYNSEDLYKPRPSLMSARRNRRDKNP